MNNERLQTASGLWFRVPVALLVCPMTTEKHPQGTAVPCSCHQLQQRCFRTLRTSSSKILITQIEDVVRGPGDYEWAVFMRPLPYIIKPEVEGI